MRKSALAVLSLLSFAVCGCAPKYAIAERVQEAGWALDGDRLIYANLLGDAAREVVRNPLLLGGISEDRIGAGLAWADDYNKKMHHAGLFTLYDEFTAVEGHAPDYGSLLGLHAVFMNDIPL